MSAFLLYAGKRLLLVFPFLIGLTILSFLLGLVAPGDPALAILTMDGSTEPTAEEFGIGSTGLDAV